MKANRLIPACLVISAVAVASTSCSLHTGRERANALRTVGMPASTGDRLYRLVEMLDRHGRVHGVLPSELAELDSVDSARVHDSWGRRIQYESTGLRFALRSAGNDGVAHNADDIVASGQVGRRVPCEIRDSRGPVNWNEFAPACVSQAPVKVFPLCPALLQAELGDGLLITATDSVAVTGRRMAGFARRIEGANREVGGVVPTLRRVPASGFGVSRWSFADVWGTSVQYLPSSDMYELRSAGSDREYRTADDIIVSGQLGVVPDCEYAIGGVREICAIPAPRCP